MSWSAPSSLADRIHWMPSNDRFCLCLRVWDRQWWAIHCRRRCPNRLADTLRSVRPVRPVAPVCRQCSIRCLDVDWHESLHWRLMFRPKSNRTRGSLAAAVAGLERWMQWLIECNWHYLRFSMEHGSRMWTNTLTSNLNLEFILLRCARFGWMRCAAVQCFAIVGCLQVACERLHDGVECGVAIGQRFEDTRQWQAFFYLFVVEEPLDACRRTAIAWDARCSEWLIDFECIACRRRIYLQFRTTRGHYIRKKEENLRARKKKNRINSDANETENHREWLCCGANWARVNHLHATVKSISPTNSWRSTPKKHLALPWFVAFTWFL